MTYNDFIEKANLNTDGIFEKTLEVKVTEDFSLDVRQRLTADEKARMIVDVLQNVVDENTATASPLRVEIYATLAICHWYAGIDFEGVSMYEAYDLLDSTGIIDKISNSIPKDELDWVLEMVNDTIDDYVRYSNSFAGIVTRLADSTKVEDLVKQVNETLENIKDAKGLEQLSVIKDVVGNA